MPFFRTSKGKGHWPKNPKRHAHTCFTRQVLFYKNKEGRREQQYCTLVCTTLIAELHARAKRAPGRSPIAKEIYPSQKIW